MTSMIDRRIACLMIVTLTAWSTVGCGSSRHAPSQQASRQPLYPTYPQLGQVAAIDKIRLGRSQTLPTAVINVIPGGGDPPAYAGQSEGASPTEPLDPRVRIPRGPDGPEIYRITVKMVDGYVRSFDYEQLGGIRLGDRVKVEQGQLSRY